LQPVHKNVINILFADVLYQINTDFIFLTSGYTINCLILFKKERY